MKILNLHLIFILLLTATFISCGDNIPRNRPILSLGETTISPPEPEIEIDEGPSRPSGAVIISPDHCVCSAGKAVSIGICDTFCSQKSRSDDPTNYLYFDIELKPDITESSLKDLSGFCNTQNGEAVVRSCSLEAKNQEGEIEQSFEIKPAPGQTSFRVDVSNLQENITYRISLVENVSQARSTTVQLRIASELKEDRVGGPLALMPVNQYTCMIRANADIDQATGELYILDVNRFHFYFIPETRPEPLNATTIPSIYCHDIERYGTTPINSPLLEETTGVFSTWNKDDPRFYDLDGNQNMEIHDLLIQNLELQGKTVSDPSTFKLFFELKWQSGIDDGDTNPTDPEQAEQAQVMASTLGYYMAPFIDDRSYKAYCPKKEHYYSSSTLFQAMRELVAVDTEGLYVGKQDNVCDFLLVKESLLKKIWFYEEAGQKIQPTDDTISGKKVQFYWPADVASPYIKKSHQRVYTVKSSSEMTCGTTTTTEESLQASGDGVRTNIPPHDKRIGCIPVLAD